ncbi:radical SAM protein [Thermotoga sp. RQ7]|uniref:radical SAM protein n=1 Tax=unclassified Thermotoga TaxID=2631113 RepID=UPI00016017D9|nr:MULTISPECIES: radical SAM protein [unclassified Thermotoga]ACB10160.1 Radical SAM domain protein [Thermotoga sp. RQ2]AJG41666.1 radical SAM protein [Thermotoga sp. RQ7]
MGFDPVERSKKIENLVMKDGRRKYYRFRYSLYYSGIVTADSVGCNLLCAYCWNYFKNMRSEKVGDFFSPEEVAEKLVEISRKRRCDLFRISGAEPILGRKSAEHTKEVMKLVKGTFILETNGILFGYDPSLVDLFTDFDVLVRVNVKGWDEENFERITGADGWYFHYQLKALENLYGKVRFWVAVMYDLFGEEGLSELKKKLPVPCRIEKEYLEAYPFVVENLRKRGVVPKNKIP